MKTNKITIKIEVEVLSIDAAPAVITNVIKAITKEQISGELVADDGDTVRWETSTEEVEF